ncbi:MAG: efflux RND transporter permease subunit [SAR324 cluster bacterium]|nr:efflux RND transporter permease subunit [SAR324 cluster bacterium]
MKISQIAIKNPASVYLFTAMIAILGMISYAGLPRESSPDIQIPLLIVVIPFPGASPEDVESLITRKVEVEFQGLENLKKINSTSTEGAATITLEFNPDFDVSAARTKVKEALDKVKPELPEEAEDPMVNEIKLSEQPMMIINLSGEIGLYRLKEVAEELKDQIETIPGILEVRRVGGLEREIRVYANPEKLRHYRLDMSQLTHAIEMENTNIPGGTITMGPVKFLIRVPGEFETPEGVENALVSSTGQVPVLVKDIAHVVFGFKEVVSRSRLDQVESVSLSVVKRSGANLLAIRDEIRSMVDRKQEEYDKQVRLKILSDQGNWIKRLVTDLENNIISGFILVFVVLLVVMGVRNSLFVAVAIPLSFLMTMVILDRMGFTLNMMVLFSLILALGMLVDNAIVVVENIYRHLQSGKPRLESALIGINEVSVPIVTSTLTTLAAFAPMMSMPGIVGEFMSFLPKTLIVALTCSLVVGLLINPVLCSTMMKIPKDAHDHADEIQILEHSRFLRWYRVALNFCLRFRVSTLLLTIILFFTMIGAYANTTLKRRGVEFFPVTEPNEAVINITAPMGSTLDFSDSVVNQVEHSIESYRDSMNASVANVGQRRGFGAQDAGSSTTFLSHVVVEFPDWQHWNLRPSDVILKLRESLNGITGAEVRVSKNQMGPPQQPPVNIEIRGEDFKVMKKIAEGIKQKIKDLPGLVDLRDDFDQSRPEVRVEIDREKAGRLGLRAMDLAMTVRTAFNGRKVSVFRDGKDEYDIVVQLDEEFRQDIQNLENLYIYTPTGKGIPLSELADIRTGPAFGSIRHVDLDRVLTVSANAEGLPGAVVLQSVQKALADFERPKTYTLKFTGENTDRDETQRFLIQSFFIAIFFIYIILTMQFNSLMVPLIILSSVILSLMGVFMGIMIHDVPFSVMMAGIGVVSLAGIVVNNAIVLIDFIQQLTRRGIPRDEAIALAGMARMRPVMLTAITTVLGLVPVAIGMDLNFYRWPIAVFGAESSTFWKPMANAIIYGLSVATFLTLFVVPVLYSTLDGLKNWLSKKIFKK